MNITSTAHTRKNSNVSYLLAALAAITIVLAFCISVGMEENGMITFEHSLAVVLAIAAAVIGYDALLTLNEGDLRKSLFYFVVGILLLGLTHFSAVLFEVFYLIKLPTDSIMHIEHLFVYAALVLFAIGFYKVKK